jgi:hypothetical protein
MSHDRRRPLQPDLIIDPAERLVLRVSTQAESKAASKPDSRRLATEVMQRLRQDGFDCAMLDGPSGDDTPRTLH